MTKKQKKMRKRILIALGLFILVNLLPLQGVLKLAAFLVPYAIIGHDVLRGAVNGIRNGQVFDERFLMAIATVGALVLGEYSEAVAVMREQIARLEGLHGKGGAQWT